MPATAEQQAQAQHQRERRALRKRRGSAQLMKHVLPMLSRPVHGIGLPPSTRIRLSTSGSGAKGAHPVRTGGGGGFGDGLPPLPLQWILWPAFQSAHAQKQQHQLRAPGFGARRGRDGTAGQVPGARCQVRRDEEARQPRVTGLGRALQRMRTVAAAAADHVTGNLPSSS